MDFPAAMLRGESRLLPLLPWAGKWGVGGVCVVYGSVLAMWNCLALAVGLLVSLWLWWIFKVMYCLCILVGRAGAGLGVVGW